MRLISLLLFIIVGQVVYGQSDKQKAYDLGMKAIELMDNGKIDESIKLLEEAQALDPDRFVYPYEIAYAHYLKGDYKGAIKILEKIRKHKDVSDRLFQLLGNSYDNIGNSDKAFDVYDEGLKLFPNSGIIYLEIGNVFWGKKEYGKALPYYEKGIEVDPEFPSNYYRATLIYCSSTEEVWGMIYGEIFMNLERNSKRTSEISKILYDVYKSEIKFTSDTSFSVSFSQNATISVDDLKDAKNFKLPYGIGFYEQALMLSMVKEKAVDINSLDRARTNFVGIYLQNDNNKKYPNILFDYQNKILKAGHMEAYNHWVLMKGDEEAFGVWYSANTEKWESFMKWFAENGLKVSSTSKFYSGQY